MSADPPSLVLGSASPRRLDLLAQIGVQPVSVIPAHIDEGVAPDEPPAQYAQRMAREKAATVAASGATDDAAILAADTVVAVGRRILPKAEDATTARACLRLLSGRRHRVYGGVCVLAPAQAGGRKEHLRLVQTAVAFKRLDQGEIDAYIESGEWDGKAGGYAIQGRAEGLVRFINGSYSNVVGLPLFETRQVLKSLGIAP
ncbi:MAG: nucleoside triphosphate pyrophosphatase [Alphaproteobacteria bacterium]|nr:nucleoside triphosphate pyrophosphatase [Alphaproteobacteria bacterium]